MIQIKELYIDKDNSNLHIWTEIEDIELFEDVTIHKIHVTTQDYFEGNSFPDPTQEEDSSMLIYDANSEDEILRSYIEFESDDKKIVKLKVSLSDILTILDKSKNKNNIYYIRIEADVTNVEEALETDCGTIEDVKLGVVINDYIIHKLMLADVSLIMESCCNSGCGSANCNFTNNFLQFQLITTAFKANKFSVANHYWNKWFSDKKYLKLKYKNSCNGMH